MNLLRSPGPTLQPLEEMVTRPASPRAYQPTSPQCPPLEHFTASTFDHRRLVHLTNTFYFCWHQWGWDMREMSLPLTHDHDLVQSIAEVWVLPAARGYLPPKYLSLLAGDRLVALSKSPNPGVRPICISDALRRLVGKGQLARDCCSFPCWKSTTVLKLQVC